jgi:hypothetical protein
MSEIGSRAMQLSRLRLPLLATVVAALLAVIGVALKQELAPRAAVAPVVTESSHPEQLVALSPDEESYAAALWPIHSEIVEASAVRLSYAGVAYMIEHHDQHRLTREVKALRDSFAEVDGKARALPVPPSMHKVHEIYLAALALYKDASAEVLKIDQDGDVTHLQEAQNMTHQAAENLLKVGDVLWPGEHKPN